MALALKFKTNIPKEEKGLYLEELGVVLPIVFIFIVSLIVLKIVPPANAPALLLITIIFTIFGSTLLLLSTTRHIRSPHVKLRRIEKKYKTSAIEAKQRDQFISELQQTTFSFSKFVKKENIEAILAIISSRLNVEKVMLWVRRDDYLAVEATSGVTIDEMELLLLPLKSKSCAVLSFRTGRTLIARPVGTDPTLNQKLVRILGAQEAIFMPIKVAGETIAVLAVINKKRGILRQMDIRHLKYYAFPLVSALQNASLAQVLDKTLETEQEFIYDLAHYLKTPLTSLRGEFELVLQKNRSLNSKNEAIRLGVTTIDKLSKTLHNILQLAQTGLSDQKYIEISLNEVLDEAYDIANIMTRRKGLDFDFQNQGNAKILGEKDKILQAVLCILDNAVKYTPRDGKISLILKKYNHKAQIVISDTGLGIPKKDINSIFKMFWRGQSINGASGSGLGLSIAKSIIEKHQGEISTQSKAGTGSKFTISLPLVRTKSDKIQRMKKGQAYHYSHLPSAFVTPSN